MHWTSQPRAVHMVTRAAISILSVVLALSANLVATDGTLGGFDVSNATIPTKEIRGGGPPRDGIPSIDQPRFWTVAEAGDFLRDKDTVLGFVRHGQARAYPLRILVHHEIVNDVVAGEPVAVTYCPLCGTAMVFSRNVLGSDKPPPTFGVSGLLYQSDVLMYDRTTESLWSQLAAESVAGPMAGTNLDWLASTQTTWGAWKENYPASLVLSTATGHRRDYRDAPYGDYKRSSGTMFPVPRHRRELRQKDWVVGIVVNGAAKAYRLKALDTGEMHDELGGTRISVHYEKKTREFSARLADGTAIPSVHAYWFAWQAFHPETELHE